MPPFPAVISGLTKNAMFVALPLASVIVTVCCPPDTVRATVAVTLEFGASAFRPVRFA